MPPQPALTWPLMYSTGHWSCRRLLYALRRACLQVLTRASRLPSSPPRSAAMQAVLSCAAGCWYCSSAPHSRSCKWQDTAHQQRVRHCRCRCKHLVCCAPAAGASTRQAAQGNEGVFPAYQHMLAEVHIPPKAAPVSVCAPHLVAQASCLFAPPTSSKGITHCSSSSNSVGMPRH